MVYRQNLVACIKVNGQVLRESDNTVSIPFGSEYSVLLKNLNSKRVQVKVSVDGQDVTEGTWLIIGPNQSIELERYIKNGNLQSGNRFKFIPRTKQIEKHRGLKADDGLVCIEYKTERVIETHDFHITRTMVHKEHTAKGRRHGSVPPVWPRWHPFWYGDVYCGGAIQTVNTGLSGRTDLNGNITYTSSGNTSADASSVNMMVFNSADVASPTSGGPRLTKSVASSPLRSRSIKSSMMKSAVPMVEEVLDDSGITVPGSESHQQFHPTAGFDTHEQTEVIVIKLRGAVGGAPVVKAVTVKTKTTCPTCGKKSKGDKKFCAQCGTALNIL